MGHSRPEVVFTENYVFGELKCDVEVLKKKKTTKLSLLSTLTIVFKIRLQKKLE